jgi:hypothetical protein
VTSPRGIAMQLVVTGANLSSRGGHGDTRGKII